MGLTWLTNKSLWLTQWNVDVLYVDNMHVCGRDGGQEEKRTKREGKKREERGPEERTRRGEGKREVDYFLTVNGLAATRRVKEEGVNTPARVDVT